MYKIKKYLILFFVVDIIGIFLYFMLPNLKKNEFEKSLKSWEINLETSGFTLKDFSKEETNASGKERVEAVRKDTTMIINKNEIPNNSKFIEGKKFLLESLFSKTNSPYPEVITQVIECPDKFKPKEIKVKNGTIYKLFAGERFTYGICSQDIVRYHSAYGIFDCGGKGVFEVWVFSANRQEPEGIVGSFSC